MFLSRRQEQSCSSASMVQCREASRFFFCSHVRKAILRSRVNARLRLHRLLSHTRTNECNGKASVPSVMTAFGSLHAYRPVHLCSTWLCPAFRPVCIACCDGRKWKSFLPSSGRRSPQLASVRIKHDAIYRLPSVVNRGAGQSPGRDRPI